MGDITIEIKADDSAIQKAMRDYADELLREYRLEEVRRIALDIDNQFMSGFFIPAPTPTDRCPFCREPIDLDKVNAVGPKGTTFEGKIIHRACEITLLQKQRNQQLAEERGEEIAISF